MLSSKILLSVLPLALVQAQDPSVSDVLATVINNPGCVGLTTDNVGLLQELHSQAHDGQLSLCDAACALISLRVDLNAVSKPTDPTYQGLPYWSIQQVELTPKCRVDVTSAQDISAVLQMAEQFSCPFAVKSGGHAAFAGASSIQDGILVNLKKMNQVVVSGDRGMTSIGPGNNWYDVYSVLDPLGVSVVGGREAGVGVGGLLLGGGISYFSGRFGWACDNVLNYEVVLANGAIVNASPTSYSDLYWALRGGSGVNFGIVSRFDLFTFEQGNLWGGSNFYSIDKAQALVSMFSNFVNNAPNAELAHLYIAFVYNLQVGGFAGVTGPTYSQPIANAPIFNEMNAIPTLANAVGTNSMSALTVALNQTTIARETFRTVTFKNDPDLIKQVVDLFQQVTTPLLNVPGFFPAIAFQPISTNILQHMQKNGGNALGLTPDEPPLTIFNTNWGWSNAADDALVLDTIKSFVQKACDIAASMGMDNRFIYMNYAGQDQDVYAGYGPESVARLKEVQSKYDPQGVFKNLQPGYFKL